MRSSKRELFAACIVALLSVAILFLPMPLWMNVASAFCVGIPTFLLLCGPITDVQAESRIRFPPGLGPSKRSETAWKIVAGIWTVLFVALPLAILTPLLWVPDGDDWPNVVARLAIVLSFAVAMQLWINPAVKFCQRTFRGRVPAGYLGPLLEEPPAVTVGLWATARSNWELLAITVAAAAVLFGVIDFNSQWLEIHHGPRRFRGFTRIVIWCRANPNTVNSSALLVGTGSFFLFVYRLGIAWHRQRSTQANHDATTERPRLTEPVPRTE